MEPQRKEILLSLYLHLYTSWSNFGGVEDKEPLGVVEGYLSSGRTERGDILKGGGGGGGGGGRIMIIETGNYQCSMLYRQLPYEERCCHHNRAH